jgi:hypothetical protein
MRMLEKDTRMTLSVAVQISRSKRVPVSAVATVAARWSTAGSMEGHQLYGGVECHTVAVPYIIYREQKAMAYELYYGHIEY